MRHEFHNDAGLSFVNEHTTAFRGAAKPGDAKSALAASEHTAIWQRELIPDEVLLFRYSALTHNTHRIHYDWRHATEQENYPALVVQGPLIATLLMDLLRRNAADAAVLSLELKAVRPTFAGRPMRVCGRQRGSTIFLWAQDNEGWITMNATAEIAQTH
jgi:3-methylfumaryl-CoA hydratase